MKLVKFWADQVTGKEGKPEKYVPPREMSRDEMQRMAMGINGG
jgi:hypothetical protein